MINHNDEDIISIKRLIKYSAPTKFDHHPYATQWEHRGEGESISYYIQVDEDAQHPNWITFGELFEKGMACMMEASHVAEVYLKAYKQRTTEVE